MSKQGFGDSPTPVAVDHHQVIYYTKVMIKLLTFVLGGGGSRGALQVGALYALLESGYRPDLIVGTSIGAVNGAFLALHGFSKEGLDRLAAAWFEAAKLDLLPTNYLLLTVRAMLGRSSIDPSHRIRDFFITNGVTPELCFSELARLRLVMVSSDLNTGQPVLHGESPDEKVLEALLLSTALPPWSRPVRKQGRYEMDGGVVSNLPVEPALKAGATEIVALDLTDTRESPILGGGVAGFLNKLSMAVEKRGSVLELELAEARGIPTFYIELLGKFPVPLWNFQYTNELISEGYEIARQKIAALRSQ